MPWPPKMQRKRETERVEERKQRRVEHVEKDRAKAILDFVEDWTCPITYALLFDPVEAEDGRLYERAAIEEYLERKANDGMVVKSPVTNEEMGKRLVPATHVKAAITKLVESGQVDAETTATWKQARMHLAQVNALRAKAEAGDAHAMGRLGFSYRDGTRGLAKRTRGRRSSGSRGRRTCGTRPRPPRAASRTSTARASSATTRAASA